MFCNTISTNDAFGKNSEILHQNSYFWYTANPIGNLQNIHVSLSCGFVRYRVLGASWRLFTWFVKYQNQVSYEEFFFFDKDSIHSIVLILYFPCYLVSPCFIGYGRLCCVFQESAPKLQSLSMILLTLTDAGNGNWGRPLKGVIQPEGLTQ